MNHSHMFYDGKVLGMTDDGWMAYSSLVFGLFAAYQWRREAQIASLIAYAAVCSYAEHILRYELLTWLDRAAALSLAIVLVRRVGFIPRRCHLAVAALLWATCDILYGNLSRPLYVSLHTCGQRRNQAVVRASRPRKIRAGSGTCPSGPTSLNYQGITYSIRRRWDKSTGYVRE